MQHTARSGPGPLSEPDEWDDFATGDFESGEDDEL